MVISNMKTQLINAIKYLCPEDKNHKNTILSNLLITLYIFFKAMFVAYTYALYRNNDQLV